MIFGLLASAALWVPQCARLLSGDDSAGLLSMRAYLVLACVFSSTDSVAPLTLIPKAKYPLVYAVVFGEAVVNDAVAILLASSVLDAGSDSPSALALLVNMLFFMAT